MDSLRGNLLISSVRLGDPNFARSVVLILAHDEQGALGLVLNRPIEAHVDVPVARTARIFQGGPCDVGKVTLAVFDDNAGAFKGIELGPGVRWSSDSDEINALLQTTEGEARFFLGYSGWTAGQLEGELEEDAWLTLPARPEHVFGASDTSPNHLWVAARTETMGGGQVHPGRVPDDPSVNWKKSRTETKNNPDCR